MSQIVVSRRAAPSVLVFKAVLAVTVVLVGSFLSRREASVLELLVFYLVPFASALLVPAALTDFATGIAAGAAAAELPLAVFGSVSSVSSLADPIFIRTAAVVLAAIAFSAVVAYRRDGESSTRFYSAAAISVTYVLLVGAVG